MQIWQLEDYLFVRPWFAALLQPDQNAVAEGILLANPLGKVLEVHQIAVSRDQLNEVQELPRPGGKKGRRGAPTA
jgi:hypothetical protein